MVWNSIILPKTVSYQAHPDRTKSPDDVEIKLTKSAITRLSNNLPEAQLQKNLEKLGQLQEYSDT